MANLEEGSIKTGSQPPYTPPRVVRMGDVSGGAGGTCSPTGIVNSSGDCLAGTMNTGAGSCTAGETNTGTGCIAGNTNSHGTCIAGGNL